jgi:uncharacterized protein (DUF697 family)
MNKKKLPRAVLQTADEMREAATLEWPQVSVRRTSANELAEASAAPSAPAYNVVEMMPKSEAAPPPAANPATLPAPTPLGIDVTRRRSVARAIVDRHAKYSAAGGIIPLPVLTLAGITAIIVRMVKMLSDLYGVPFERDRARAIVLGLVGGTMPTGFGAVTASTLMYIVPGGNLIGLAVSSVTAVACTRRIGRVFIEHFENGATLLDFPAAEAR